MAAQSTQRGALDQLWYQVNGRTSGFLSSGHLLERFFLQRSTLSWGVSKSSTSRESEPTCLLTKTNKMNEVTKNLKHMNKLELKFMFDSNIAAKWAHIYFAHGFNIRKQLVNIRFYYLHLTKAVCKQRRALNVEWARFAVPFSSFWIYLISKETHHR